MAQYVGLDGEWKAGVRPPNVIETPKDVEWVVARATAKQTRLVCRWCGADVLVRNVNEGLRWFNTHPCAEGIAA